MPSTRTRVRVCAEEHPRAPSDNWFIRCFTVPKLHEYLIYFPSPLQYFKNDLCISLYTRKLNWQISWNVSCPCSYDQPARLVLVLWPARYQAGHETRLAGALQKPRSRAIYSQQYCLDYMHGLHDLLAKWGSVTVVVFLHSITTILYLILRKDVVCCYAE